LKALLNHAQMLYGQARERVATALLNKVVRQALEFNPPPPKANRRPKIYYATQVGSEPPTVIMFCNDPAGFDEPYRRYLLGALRDSLPFAEVPIKLYLRKRAPGDRRAEVDTDAEGPEVVEGTASETT
jgi:GTP-binding protein